MVIINVKRRADSMLGASYGATIRIVFAYSPGGNDYALKLGVSYYQRFARKVCEGDSCFLEILRDAVQQRAFPRTSMAVDPRNSLVARSSHPCVNGCQQGLSGPLQAAIP